MVRITGRCPRATIAIGTVHEMDLEERFEYARGQYAPGRKLSEAEVAALFKQLRAQDPTRMRVIEAVLAEAAAHDVITRRRKIKLEQDEEGLIDAVLTIVIGVNDKGKIKVAMASRRVVDATMHTGSLKMYMGSPMRPELKERLYVDTKDMYVIDAAVMLNVDIARPEADSIDQLKDGVGAARGLGTVIVPQARETGKLNRLEAGKTVAGASLTVPRGKRQRGRELRIHINECEGKTEEAKEREAASRFGSGQETAAQQYAMNNPTEKSKAQRFGGDGVSDSKLLSSESTPRGHEATNLLRSHLDQGGSPTFVLDGYKMKIREEAFRIVEHAPLNENGEYVFRQGQCKGDFKLHVDEVDSDGEPLDEPHDVDDSDYDSDDDESVWLCFDVAVELKLLKPHFEVQREIADMTRPALKRELKKCKLRVTGAGPELKKRLYLHRTGQRRTLHTFY